MFLTYRRPVAMPLAELGNNTAGFSPYQGQAVKPRVPPVFNAQMQRRYRQVNPALVPTLDPGLAAGYPERTGQGITQPPRSSPRFLRQAARRFKQTPLEWGMLGGTVPSLPAGALVPTSVKPRITAGNLNRFKTHYRQVDQVAAVGPGLSARPPFQGISVPPRFTARDFLTRLRRYKQTDPRGAMSGLTSRGVGDFVGPKTAFLTVATMRSVTGFNVTPYRTAKVDVEPGA